ncbi:uncharacterized protein IWZ02DRAFT_287560 [Phyllosticta citriasiana]|uniref:uncharacterized protein n=1 Tax=Phyllosticta citriasiana TaxID=595635 RepID=UPI0030FD22FF
MTPKAPSSSTTDDKPQTPPAPPLSPPVAPPHVASKLEPASAQHAPATLTGTHAQQHAATTAADVASAPSPMPPPPPPPTTTTTTTTSSSSSSSSSSSVSSFRNVSACNRCRLRKNRCDQRLPACASCEKAHVKCVGYDPITKQEIPRRCVEKLNNYKPVSL